ncbi:uncharacterized protein LOC115632683 [Scaptodrosophila lebanonensis]|uniref:Uncharacterized protein LOC115632683 n=1 Tax=Drosophila lebanonensis TaxID=7225 RepID=A0A6J2UBN8_DROLE|nr:uncharacterized protein LOC115632683 [Scaptodrosophila lebanonensis]
MKFPTCGRKDSSDHEYEFKETVSWTVAKTGSAHKHHHHLEEGRRYCELDEEGNLRCRKLTTYETKLEEDIESLQDALFTMTSHYSRIQFRLRQITNSTGSERCNLLRELERITCEGLDGRMGLEEMPSLECDAKSMGNVRLKQRKIISQLRGKLKDLATESQGCFETDEGDGCYGLTRRGKYNDISIRKEGQDGGDEADTTVTIDEYGNMTPPSGKGCMCCTCQKRLERMEQDLTEARPYKEPVKRYLPETWQKDIPDKHKKKKSKSKSRAKSKSRGVGGGFKTDKLCGRDCICTKAKPSVSSIPKSSHSTVRGYPTTSYSTVRNSKSSHNSKASNASKPANLFGISGFPRPFNSFLQQNATRNSNDKNSKQSKSSSGYYSPLRTPSAHSRATRASSHSHIAPAGSHSHGTGVGSHSHGSRASSRSHIARAGSHSHGARTSSHARFAQVNNYSRGNFQNSTTNAKQCPCSARRGPVSNGRSYVPHGRLIANSLQPRDSDRRTYSQASKTGLNRVPNAERQPLDQPGQPNACGCPGTCKPNPDNALLHDLKCQCCVCKKRIKEDNLTGLQRSQSDIGPIYGNRETKSQANFLMERPLIVEKAPDVSNSRDTLK